MFGPKSKEPKKTEDAPSGPVHLFHKENVRGKTFCGEDVAKALKEGWVDTPAKLRSKK